MENEYLTVREVAKYLKISISMINSLIKQEEIPSIKIGKRRLFIKKDVDKWIEEHKKRKKK